jgi:uncharacterized SAM-binding protein YcdF (DUF218 family)
MIEFIKFLTWCVTPLTLAMLGMVVALWCLIRGRKKLSGWLGALTLLWLLFWSLPAVYIYLGCKLESAYPPRPVAEYPPTDVIVVLGGGVQAPEGPSIYPDMNSAADRVWHAARLYHAGKAPLVMPSGINEVHGMAVLLRDMGVPENAIRVENESRTTRENAQNTAVLLKQLGAQRVLLVTSAWHMRRAMECFRRAGIEATPAATDHEAMLARAHGNVFPLGMILPNAEMLFRNTFLLKEYLGMWAIEAFAKKPQPQIQKAAAPAGQSHAS